MKLNTRYSYSQLLEALSRAEARESTDSQLVQYQTSGTLGHHPGDTLVITAAESRRWTGLWVRWNTQFSVERKVYPVKVVNGVRTVMI